MSGSPAAPGGGPGELGASRAGEDEVGRERWPSGPRLALRPIRATDAVAVHAARTSPEGVRFLATSPADLDAVRCRIAADAERWRRAGEERFNLVLAAAAGDELAVELHAWNAGEPGQPASDDPSEVWIGFVAVPAHRGKGLAREALSLLLEWLAGRGARRAFANVYADNTASRRLLASVGFVEDAYFAGEAGTDGCAARDWVVLRHELARS